MCMYSVVLSMYYLPRVPTCSAPAWARCLHGAEPPLGPPPPLSPLPCTCTSKPSPTPRRTSTLTLTLTLTLHQETFSYFKGEHYVHRATAPQ